MPSEGEGASCPSVPSDRTVARTVLYSIVLVLPILDSHAASIVCLPCECVCCFLISPTPTPAASILHASHSKAQAKTRPSLTALHLTHTITTCLRFISAQPCQRRGRTSDDLNPLRPSPLSLLSPQAWVGPVQKKSSKQQAASSTVKKETPLKIVIIPYVPFFTSTQNCAASETTTVLQTRYCTLNLALHYRTQ